MQTWFINGRHMSRAEMLKWKEKRNEKLKELGVSSEKVEKNHKEDKEVKMDEEKRDVEDKEGVTTEDKELAELNAKYTEKTGKEATGRWAHDKEWLQDKINN